MDATSIGFPKSGNHAVVKAIQLLDVTCAVSHQPYTSKLKGKIVFIRRDPRNVVCSWLRFKGEAVTAENFIARFRLFSVDSLCNEMAPFEGWLRHKKALVVSYEDLIASDREMRRIADYLGVPYIEGAFDSLPGLTLTWYPNHSDYKTIWTDEVDAIWRAEGGADLQARWGY